VARYFFFIVKLLSFCDTFYRPDKNNRKILNCVMQFTGVKIGVFVVVVVVVSLNLKQKILLNSFRKISRSMEFEV